MTPTCFDMQTWVWLQTYWDLPQSPTQNHPRYMRTWLPSRAYQQTGNGLHKSKLCLRSEVPVWIEWNNSKQKNIITDCNELKIKTISWQEKKTQDVSIDKHFLAVLDILLLPQASFCRNGCIPSFTLSSTSESQCIILCSPARRNLTSNPLSG